MFSPVSFIYSKRVGTVELSRAHHISVGYTSDAESLPTWSCSGQWSGSVWLKVQTPALLVSSRCLGPLLALVSVGQLELLKDPNNNQQHSMEEMTRQISQWIKAANETGAYRRDLDSAFSLWKDYVKHSWQHRPEISKDEYTSLQDRINTNQLRFRLSCLREHSDLSYSRSDLLKSVLEECGAEMLPYFRESSSSSASGWKVDLTRYDIEMALILLKEGTIAIGFSLCPYSFLKANSFAIGGVPPDITPPYVGGDLLSEGLVRLRPTTAHILLNLASLQPYEVVLDPCAGIGTIPMEADRYYFSCNGNGTSNNNTTRTSSSAIGLGGDVALHHPTLATAASALEQYNHTPSTATTTASSSSSSSSSMLAAWDAAQLPIRNSSVDVIVSDLPFGKQCLSANALNQLLPLLLMECARVLVPKTGRMVLLCGVPNAILQALEESQEYWIRPCTIVTPVTIGGLLAWIVRVERNHVLFSFQTKDRTNAHITTTTTTTNYIDRVRTLAKKRDRIAQVQTTIMTTPHLVQFANKKKTRIQK